MQEPPNQPEPEQRKKPGPHEKLHTLYPLTLGQALERAFKFKPKKKRGRSDNRKPEK